MCGKSYPSWRGFAPANRHIQMADMFSCADKGPSPAFFCHTFSEEVNFCHRAVTNAIKVMQFLLLAEREKSCLLTRMKDRPRAMTKYSGSGAGFLPRLKPPQACRSGVHFPSPRTLHVSIFNFHAYYILLFLIMTKLCNPTFATLHTPSPLFSY